MDLAAELHDLGAIRVDPPRRALGLARMFPDVPGSTYVRNPGSGARTPLATDAGLTLPLPAEGVSPLSKLFGYPDLVPCVLEHLRRPGHVASAMRVCKAWRWALRRGLYGEVWVRPWEAAPKPKLINLFRTLARDSELCALVKVLDIRFFPLDLQGDALTDLEANILVALRGMTSLSRLVWTRDRSISAELFAVIASLPVLSLEMSGHSAGFDIGLLGTMERLTDLRIMMPDAGVRSALPYVLAQLDSRPQGGLTGLGLVCKASNLINDALLLDIAPSVGLKRLTLMGAKRISKTGLYGLLGGVEELVLDIPDESDLLDLFDAPFSSLHTLSLSFRGLLPRVHAPQLRALELHSGPSAANMSPRADVLGLAEQVDFGNLSRVAVLGLVLDGELLRELVRLAPRLEELYFSINSEDTLEDVDFSPLKNLRVWHANSHGNYVSREVLARVAATLPVEEIGSGNRVYEVVRREVDGASTILLTRWGRVETPSYFRVWRP